MGSRPFQCLLLASVLALAACKDEGDEPKPTGDGAERTILTLQSYVLAFPEDTNVRLLARIRDQIRSSFGSLAAFRVTGSNRAEPGDSAEQLYREPLILVGPGGEEKVVVRVWFRYSDEVFAPATVPRGVPLLVGGLHRQDDARFTKVVTECTPNTARERELRGRLHTAFDGSMASCQNAILAEQAEIDAARVRLSSPEDEIVPEELERVYLPVVARLLGKKASRMGRYPRFEPVVPQAVSSVAAVASTRPVNARPVAAADTPAVALFDGDGPAERPREQPPEKTEVIVVPGGGMVADNPPSGVQDEEIPGLDTPPDPQAGVPIVVVAAAPANPNAPVVTRDSGRSFDWEDLLDKRFLALWVAVFALYPLLRRRNT